MSAQPSAPAALVTGGTRGIGRAVSVGLAKRGGTVIVNYLQNDQAAAETRALVERHGARCVPLKANLLLQDDIERLFAQVREVAGSVDAFVHCAALNAFKPLVEVKPNQWDLTMNTNARAFLTCVQKLLPLMPGGTIVAVSSLGGQRVVANYGAMGPTKAALEAVVRYLAAELAPRGIRVNAVSGGLVDTESVQRFPRSEELAREAVSRTPAGRIGLPDDLAEVILFLIGPAARWIYGQTIIADGGLSLS